MIGRLEGRLQQLRPGAVLVDAGGVGYVLNTTLRAPQQLGERERGALWVHTQVRSDAIVLYGFVERGELDAFERLIGVAGIGPRTALAVLSSLSPQELAAVVDGADAARLQRIPGLGRKSADRIILELRGRLEVDRTGRPGLAGDAASALVNLGYPVRDAERAVGQVLAEHAEAALPEVLRLALQQLGR